MVTVYGYAKCSTVRKTLKFLNENNIEYLHIDNVENKLTVEELRNIFILSKCDVKKLFNTSGMVYRELNLKNKLLAMSNDEKLELLASNGMLVKRPLLVTDKQVVIGFKEDEILELVHDS